MTAEHARPLPQPDDASRPFFEAAREHRLLLQQCAACGAYRFPVRPRCDECWSTDWGWAEAGGRGTLYTYAVMHQVLHPGFAGEVPYNVAVVELEEGPRITTTIVGCPNEELRAGMSVQVVFEDLTEEVSLPKFRPLG